MCELIHRLYLKHVPWLWTTYVLKNVYILLWKECLGCIAWQTILYDVLYELSGYVYASVKCEKCDFVLLCDDIYISYVFWKQVVNDDITMHARDVICFNGMVM